MNAAKEESIKKFWEARSIYKKARGMWLGSRKFYFLDGPPYATGSIHIGTAWNKILKDMYIRFFRMSGYDVWDQPGYDTHGLPIENKVQEELGIRSKAEIEKLGIDKFIARCRKFATQHIDAMNAQFADLGVWMDWENPYLTLENEYIASAWHTFKTAYEKGFLYRGLYPVHVCPHCVDPNSTVLVEGGTRKIGELANCWKHNKILSIDTESKELNITNPLGYIEHEEEAFLVKTKIGKKLIASADHPFWTKQGWMPLAELKYGAKVAVYNSVESPLPKITEKGSLLLDESKINITIESLETLTPKNTLSCFNDLSSDKKIAIKNIVYELRNKGYSYTQIARYVKDVLKIKISKSWVSKILKRDTSTRYDFIIKELKEKELIPLYSKSSKAFILAKLFGHIFGDGSIIIKKSKNRKFPIFSIVFTGKEEDLKEIQRDLDVLGYSYSSISKVESKSMINGRLVKGFSTYMRCYSLSLAILLISLGAPVGRKTQIRTTTPKWIDSNKKLSREFLAAYFGSELDIIKPRKYGKGFEVLRLHLTKDRHIEKDGIEFAKNICKLIKKFGITTSDDIRIEKRKINGRDKSKITISMDCNDTNLVKFTRFLGYEYCKQRKIRASHVLGYLLYKKRMEKERQKLKNKILSLRGSGVPCSKIAIQLNLPELYIRHIVYGKPKSVRGAKYISTFDDWLKNVTENLKDGIIWDEIENIKYLGKRKVCDIAVEKHHNFITNGFLTHNCETAVAYNEIEYKKVPDPSIYVKFSLRDEKNTFLLVWTTTPWTLPANTGIMAKPSADYIKVKIMKDAVESGRRKSEVLILAKELLETVMKKAGIEGYEVVEELKGKRLKDIEYIHPFADIPAQKQLSKARRVVLNDQFVTLTDGTGLVHVAPGHGQEDYKVGVENELPVVSPVRMNGKMDESCGKYANLYVKTADKTIIGDLSAAGLLLHEEKITHDYPHCWRCDSALIIISVPQWFFRVSELRNRLIAENEKVSWSPAWAGQRFRNWIECLGDWPVSRQRYWGIPLPIWTCGKCGAIRVISADELPQEMKDLHRPYIDSVRLRCRCGCEMERIKDVLDVWFDSGLCSWASLGYPGKDEKFKRLWPADLNIEGPDQIRGWWNSQLITSVITFDKAPFKNILFHGFVLDAKGVKMAKSKGNVVTPRDVVKKYNRDILRLYLLSSAPWDDFYFNWKDVDAVGKAYMVLENTFNFMETYTTRVKRSDLKPEDRWILSKMNSLIVKCTSNFEAYNAHKAVNDIKEFMLQDFSRTYIKIIRDRVWPAYGGDDAAFYTLYEVSKNISRIIAPVCPFIAEDVHQKIMKFGETNESVHLCSWPKADRHAIDTSLESMMETAKKIAEAANTVRQKNKIKLRWPLRSMIVSGQNADELKVAVKTFGDVIRSMCNVKNVRFGTADFNAEAGGIKIFLDTAMDDALKEEAMVRELMRKVQEDRKKAGMTISEKIVLTTDADLKKFEDMIKKEVGAKSVVAVDGLIGETLELFGNRINYKVKKAK